MASSMNSLLCFILTAIFTFLHLLLLASALIPSSSTPPPSFPSSPSSDTASSALKALLTEEKTRLGSTPPSCHNKCNECHPCMAVQVTTIPSRGDRVRVRPTQIYTERRNQISPVDAESSDKQLVDLESITGGNNRYSNYKPLGWKCRCRNHFFNP